jgi:tRNA threonylcarbamoyladenosine biosynthesis protein TsaB
VRGNETKDYSWEANRDLAKGILRFLQDKLKENGSRFEDIEGIGVFEGPGSFTGLRIGMSVLNTLADSLKVPIVAARGENWQEQVLSMLQKGEDQKIVLPFYGSDPHITKQKK